MWLYMYQFAIYFLPTASVPTGVLETIFGGPPYLQQNVLTFFYQEFAAPCPGAGAIVVTEDTFTPWPSYHNEEKITLLYPQNQLIFSFFQGCFLLCLVTVFIYLEFISSKVRHNNFKNAAPDINSDGDPCFKVNRKRLLISPNNFCNGSLQLMIH